MITVEIADWDPTRIRISADYRWREVIKTLPGATWNRDHDTWAAPLSWSTCLGVRAVFKDLTIGPLLTAWARNYVETKIRPGLALRDALEAELPGDEDLFPYQQADVLFLSTIKRAMLFSDMGCLAGDTLIGINRGGAARKLRIDYVAKKFEEQETGVLIPPSRGQKVWRTDIPTMVSRAAGDGVERLAVLSNAWCSGVKETYELTTTTGRKIRATDEHPFLTSVGWARLDELSAGDQLQVNVGRSTRGRGPKAYYKQTFGMKFHPYRAEWAHRWAVAGHRVIAEAGLNGLSFDVFKDKIVAGDIVGLVFLDPAEFAVHHIDHNHLNNSPENLSIMTHSAHHTLHGHEGKDRNVLNQIGYEIVESIVKWGEEPTYDIEVADDPHNFLANGFAVHNTGKTASAIRSMRRLARDGETPWPALVVAPNSTKLGWKREFERWWPGIKVSVVKGTAVQRRKALETPAHIYVINYEALRSHSRVAPYGSHALRRCAECGGEDDSVTVGSCQVHIRELNKIDFQTVIADEAHRIKDASSITARTLKAATGKAPFRFAMTGTPIAHNVMDLWSVLNWLEPEEFPSKTRFMDRMVNVMYNVFGGMVVSGLKPECEEEFHKATDFRLRRMTKDVVLKFLPPVVEERRDVEMTPKQAKAYKDVSTSMMTELTDGTLITAGTGLIKAIRLLQLASSYGTVELHEKADGKVGEALILEDPSSKINAFMEDLPDFGPEQVVVFAVSRQLIELLSARMTSEGIAHGLVTGRIDEDERQRHIDAFQEGKTQFILCTIGAGGTGITLTAASTRVFLQRSWSSIEMAQAKDRVHRIGSERHKVISHIDYVTPGTIEEAVIAVLEGKLDSMEEILRDRELFAKAVAGKVVW